LVILVWGVNVAINRKTSENSALEILKRRYANGELTEDEFEHKLKHLGK